MVKRATSTDVTEGEMTSQISIRYEPLPSQACFHRLRSPFKGFSGPVGSGKTAALVMEAIMMALKNPGGTGLLGAPSYAMLRDVTLRAMTQTLSRLAISFTLLKSSGELTIDCCRSKILLRSLDKYENLRGSNLSWFGVDELTYVTQEAWQRLEARLRDPGAKRRHGFAVWTPKGHDWVYRRFIEKPTPQYAAVLAKPFENVHIIDAAPAYYENLKHSYDEHFYRQEVLGLYEAVNQDRVYPNFERSNSVKRAERVPELPLLWALDFNVNPMCSVVAQRVNGGLSVLDEIVIERSSTLEACEEFRSRYGNWRAGIQIYGDASGNNRRTTGATDFEIIKRFWAEQGVKNISYRVARANPSVASRVQLVNAMLKNAAGEQRLSIDPKCAELIADLVEVSYKPGATIIDKTSDPKRTHLSDALGYLVWQEWMPEVTYGERNRPLF